MQVLNQRQTNVARKGFTLVELVVVILVLGIIAAIAAPKMFDTAGDARTNSAIQSLGILRNAIELHRAQNGAFPGEAGTAADFISDMDSFLQGGPFPKNPLTAAAGDRTVAVQTTGTALVVGGGQDWKYDNVTGEFIINTVGFDTF